MRVVVKISGKFISPLDKPMIKEYAEVLDKLIEEGNSVLTVVGGGSVARRYIELVSGNKFLKDLIGIEVSRVNAQLLAFSMRRSVKKIPRNLDELLELYSLHSKEAILSGGLQPGQSTNAVALLIAEMIGAELVVNATTVDGLYDKPPSEPGARKLDVVSYEDAIKILSSSKWEQEPGKYELLDMLSLEIAKRSGIPIAIVNGSNPYNVYNAIAKGLYGTLIRGKGIEKSK